MTLTTLITMNTFSKTLLQRAASLVAMACLSTSLAGCGFFFGKDGVFHNRGSDYEKAGNIPPLVLPEGRKSEAIGEIYPIPPITATDFGYEAEITDEEVPRPMPLSANLEQENVKIQRVGNESWILLNAAPGEVWPRIRNFMNQNGLAVSRSDIGKGIIETNWLQFKTDLSSHDKYRLQIDQGVQPETTEVHITHISVKSASVPTTEPAWPLRSANPEREKWLLDELAGALAKDVDAVGTSFLAQAIGGSVKAGLGMVRGEPMISIKLDRTRAFATLGYGVKRDGFSLFESDAEAGLYYVEYIDPEENKPGWFKRKLGIGFGPKVPKTPYSLAQVKTNMLTGDAFENAPRSDRDEEEVLPDAPGYLLVVTGADNNFMIRIRDPYGKRLSPAQSRELLTILRKNLI